MKRRRIYSLIGQGLLYGAFMSIVFSCGGDSTGPSNPGPLNFQSPANDQVSHDFQTAGDNLLTGMGTDNKTLGDASLATQQGESNANQMGQGGSQFAATAADGTLGLNGDKKNTGADGSSSSATGQNGVPLAGANTSNASAGDGSGGFGGGMAGSGSGGAGIGSLGDVHTAAIGNPNGKGVTGIGSLGAGLGGDQGGAGTYAGNGGGRLGSGGGLGWNGGSTSGANAVSGPHGTHVVDFQRGPASFDENGLNKGPMGSRDPANYFSLSNPEDSIFKIVQRRYASKEREWALADIQKIKQSIHFTAVRK